MKNIIFLRSFTFILYLLCHKNIFIFLASAYLTFHHRIIMSHDITQCNTEVHAQFKKYNPLLKTFSTTSRDSFYDYEDPFAGQFDDMVIHLIISMCH